MSRSQLMQKRRGKLDREFLCYYCQHEKSVAIKIDNQAAIGYLACRICGVKFSTRVTALDEAVDVYSVWIDSCREGESLETGAKKAADSVSQPMRYNASQESAGASKDSLPTARERLNDDTPTGTSTSSVQPESHQIEPEKPVKRLIREEELSPASFSVIAGSNRSKRIIDALDETPDEPEFTVDTLTGESLFDDD